MTRRRDLYHPSSPREIFILRLWKASQGKDWYVEVQVVKTREVLHLNSLDDLPAVLRNLAAREPKSPEGV